ncbi:MAG: ABC transporter substrate-binding protein [Cypionkella sp.]|uniref:ABC transporter substrate-binding protein n=1 Tax=Cypionkella sp. TaxID=2811411 RepID=UPI002ABA9121|nr:ABC transporter substrate-binding protein [Cypionkella sp.]MDZ4312945.1 ABC transporter substrate-binding protein [Cypionkella sp.]MDZ4392510.1 ABC transporter substrate-binding protein [Cypionkella sp.]
MLKNATRRQFMLGTATAAVAPFVLGFPVAYAQGNDTVTLRIPDDISNVDPAFRVGPVEGNILSAVCQRLARFKPGSLEWEPDAAKWIKQNSDTEIEFELNPGQMFHDGYGELTAEDVKFSFERFITPDAQGAMVAYADDFGALDRVEVTGTYTGKLILKNPAPAIWMIAICDGSGSILSKKATEALGTGISTRAIGSGPYVFKEWKPRDQVVLEASPDYAGRDMPTFRQIILKPIVEPRTALLSLLAKETALTAADVTAEDELAKDSDVTVVKMEGIDYTWVSLNVEKGALADLRVRQAIRLGMDIQTVIDGAYAGKVGRANALLAPPLLGYWAEAPVYNRDIAAAQALLAEAGHSNIALTFTCLNDSTSQAIAQIVQANLSEIGINLTINALDPGAYWAMGSGDAAKDLELTLITYASKFDPSFQTQWFLGSQVGVWNWQRWTSDEFDRLHTEAASMLDPLGRQEKYVRMQQLLDESASCIWITHGVHLYGHANWLTPSILPNGLDWQLRFFKPV